MRPSSRRMSRTAKNGALICMHAENGGVIDVIVQRASGGRQDRADLSRADPADDGGSGSGAIARSRWLRWRARPVYIVHLSSEDALNKVREARDRGLPAFAETCPQYLLLSIEELERPNFEGAKYVFTPPLREKHNLPKLWDGLKHDHLQVVSTDHCPFCFEDQKALGQRRFHEDSEWRPGRGEPAATDPSSWRERGQDDHQPFRGTGVDHARELFGMYPQKGEIAVGSDADHRDLGSEGRAYDQRGDAPHARGLLDVRRVPGEGQRAAWCSRAAK